MKKPPINNIETNESSAISEMHITINGRAANVHSDTAFGDWLEYFFFSRERIINAEFIFHGRKNIAIPLKIIL
jgi:hypothetical protein